MYTANSHIELKRLMKENKFPILVTDKRIIRTVQWMEYRKQYAGAVGLALEVEVIALAVIAMITILGLYALYKEKDIEIERRPDGGMVLRTSSHQQK